MDATLRNNAVKKFNQENKHKIHINMKKIIAVAAAVLMLGSTAWAQNGKAVAEKDVKVNYVKDFQRQVKTATDVTWWQLDSLTYKVTYRDEEQSRQAMVFNNKGSEMHYIVEREYWPAAIKDTVNHLYPKFTIREVWVRKLRGKMTYQAYVARMGGFLWWKKEKEAKTINWEVDGKFIGE